MSIDSGQYQPTIRDFLDPAPCSAEARQDVRSTSDIDLAFGKLRALIGPTINPDEMIYVKHEGAPVSKSRARWSRKSGRFYTPEKTHAAEDLLAYQLRRAAGETQFIGPIAIVAIFYRPNHQRIDADNLMKLVMDAATKAGIWKDDCHVTAQASFMEFDPLQPRTLIAICRTESSLNRSERFTCQLCGKSFNRAGVAALKQPPKTCSRACDLGLRAKNREDVRCGHCQQIFQRTSAGQIYCSKECKHAVAVSPGRRQKRELQRPWPKCQICGGRVSRREYVQCANCRKRGRSSVS